MDKQFMGSVLSRFVRKQDERSITEVLRMDARSICRSSRCILTVPYWKSAPWFPLLIDLLITPPVILTGQDLFLLTHPDSRPIIPSEESKMEDTRVQFIWTWNDVLKSQTWISWCQLNNCDPITYPIEKICDFLVDMLTRERSFNTIAGYRTAISEAHELVDGVSVGTHPNISRMMHALYSENPPPVKPDDPIDIIPSLDYIRSLGDNNTMSIRNLNVKISFLTALITASRPLDLKRTDLFMLKISRNSITLECIKPKEYNIAKAHSLSSTKSPRKKFYIGNYDDERLCPYSAFTTLIDRTRQWRDTEDKKKSLFLITRESYLRIRSLNSGADLASILALGN
ncbi:hypothetical protein C1646_738985 [Rhizophagus diaphanus]|nr:hypothetical protein C1646_738985 [Rhizophagus diaphanus] [Rhizophagus sp. MUCL 43196]